MKLSKETIAILKNFATIQPNLMFKAGSELKTIAEAKNIVAKAILYFLIHFYLIYSIKINMLISRIQGSC